MKKGKQKYEFYIRSMYEEIEKAEEFIQGETYETFAKDVKLQYAVYKACENIGEATRNLSSNIKNKYPSIPWRQIASYRNKLAYEYFGIDVKIAWDTMQKDIPNLKTKIKQIIDTLDKSRKHTKTL